MRFNIYLRFFIATILVILLSCNKDKVMESTNVSSFCTDSVSFLVKIEPLIQMNCSTVGCHDAGTSASGYNLEGYTNISSNADAVLNVINHNGGFVAMPFGGAKMADTLIQQVDCWIQQGKLNN